MKKEVVLAIVIGFAIGLLITFGIYTARNAIQNQPSPSPNPVPDQIIDQQTDDKSSALKIISPQNETLFDTDQTEIKGLATPESIITIITPLDQYITTADKQGNFSFIIELKGGANIIDITAFDPEDNISTTSLTLVFSTADI